MRDDPRRKSAREGDSRSPGAAGAIDLQSDDVHLASNPDSKLVPALLPVPLSILRQLGGLSLRSRRRQAQLGQGDRRSPMRGNSLQLIDYRPYVPGDDLRQVDWNVYSRSGELFVRLYEDEKTLTIHVLVDVSRSMDWGTPNKHQAAIRLASVLAYVALSGYDQVHLGFLADRIIGQAGPYWGPRQRVAALQAMAAAPVARATDLASSITSYLDRLRRPGVLILVTDLLSPTAEEGLRRLAGARHEAIVLHLLAPQELDPEPGEDLTLVDHETGSQIDVNLDLATLERYRQRLAEWTERLSRLCRERGGRYLRVSSGDDLERGWLRALRLNGILE